MSANKKSSSKSTKKVSFVDAIKNLFISALGDEDTIDKATFLEQVQAEEFQEKLEALCKKQEKKFKPKKLKDPNAPKKPLTGYIRFSQEKRAKVKEENPELKGTEIMKKLGEMWKALSDKKKEKYNSPYKAELEAWKEEMKGYEAPSEDELKKLPENHGRVGGVKKRKTRDPNEPKRPKTAYQWFSEDVREEIKEANPEADSKEIMKLIGQAWTEVKEDEKKVKKYNKKAEKAKAEYQEKMKAYKKEKESEAEEEAEEQQEETEQEKPKEKKKKSVKAHLPEDEDE
jgi:hypothetical protein